LIIQELRVLACDASHAPEGARAVREFACPFSERRMAAPGDINLGTAVASQAG